MLSAFQKKIKLAESRAKEGCPGATSSARVQGLSRAAIQVRCGFVRGLDLYLQWFADMGGEAWMSCTIKLKIVAGFGETELAIDCATD